MYPGKHIARLCAALGMKVLISSRKNDTTSSHHTNTPQRVPFTTLLTTASVLFLAVPLSPTTRSLLAEPELSLLSPSTIIINVSRGGIVDEPAMLEALRTRKVFGYGTDVFATEPAGDGEDSCLLGAAAAESAVAAGGPGGGEEEIEKKEGKERVNLVMTGHLAWFSETTMANQMRKVGENLRAWMEGNGEGDVVIRGTR